MWLSLLSDNDFAQQNHPQFPKRKVSFRKAKVMVINMLFHSRNFVKENGSYAFSGVIAAAAHACFQEPIFKELWNSFSYRISELTITETDEFVFRIGDVQAPQLNGAAYGIRIEKDGLCICAENENNLKLGFMTLIDRMQAEDRDDETVVSLECGQLCESPLIETRMAHFCIFPETELWELQKFLRFCGALKYSHVILEFREMYQYDCMKELSWKHAYSKEVLRPLIREAQNMGLEIVPMFNHWGHAPASRVMHGKHVVLDQNPALETYFDHNGWCWDIRKPKVRKLLREIRHELCELCGVGSYFHIGCDEAYGYDLNTEEGMNGICDYINEIADEMEEENRRILVWGDMFLFRHPHYNPKNGYAANAPSAESEAYMLKRLSHKIIIADWQYDANEAPVETAAVFADAGFDCMLCPWDRSQAKMLSCVKTAKDMRLSGLIHTTWHTLSSGMPYVVMAAVGCFEDHAFCDHTASAAMLRKVFFADGDYKQAGWSKEQIGIYT